jgi:hypothetical protein
MDPFSFLKPKNTFTGIDTLRVNPLQNKYYEMIYPEYGSSDIYPESVNADSFYPMAPTGGLVDLGIDPSYGVANEEDEEQVQYLPGAEPKTGIAKLLEVLGKIPTPFNLARRGIESLSRIPRSDFFRSKNLMDYLDMRRYGGAEARERARQKNLRETAAIQKQLDLRAATGKYQDSGSQRESFRTPASKPTKTSTPKSSSTYEDAKRAFRS